MITRRPRLCAAAGLLTLAFSPSSIAPAHAQTSAETSETAPKSEAGGIEIPLIGRVQLPGFLAGWFGGDEEAAESAEAEGANAEPPAVIVQTVATQSVGDTIEFIGTIQPIEQVAVRARVDGYVQEVAFKGGQAVKAGDLLFQIEPAQYEASLRAAEAQLSGAQASVNQAERNFQRQQQLSQSGVTARATLDDATAQLENAQATFLQANAAVTQARLNLSYTRIEAAIDGVMSAPLITRGNYVSAGTTADMATLTQMDPIWGVFPIGEGQLVTWQRIGVGETQEPPIARNGETGSGAEGDQTAAIDEGGEGDAGSAPTEAAAPAQGGTLVASADGTAAAGAVPPPPGSETIEASARADSQDIGDDFVLSLRLPNGSAYQPTGRFDFVGNTVNPATGTVEARIAFPNPGGFLLANQNVTLVASERHPPVLPVVPQAAIQLSREGRSVLLVKPDETIERRTIEVGKKIGNMTSVTSGLTGGETVVVRGSAAAKENAKVRPLTEEQAEAEAEQRRASRPAAGDGTSAAGGGAAR
ncbi:MULTISPECIES: efflux RND transporter periplasmic adaptor subunit [unclassified Aureimonas]|uniref:efflux RND transporter periplasmic adaptor subunit n=1 Tax=unclassified Aureimonas TaxID=2615206 RepID=UPI0006F978F4|nr:MULTISPECIES: efflux RND transporter periplasmic adaptor subunit [unclassified Aureimonas]KQT64042.1 hypothetical protein ASG62_03220 [Aureimonas sp. Leaf427]KQT81235.1 hypothetical protein ASG54_00490 [Aureimonas sp. Leaf460]